jgi:hypothetical protein
MFSLRQFGDVEGGVAERDQRLSTRQHDWIVKPLIPWHELKAPRLREHVRAGSI